MRKLLILLLLAGVFASPITADLVVKAVRDGDYGHVEKTVTIRNVITAGVVPGENSVEVPERVWNIHVTNEDGKLDYEYKAAEGRIVYWIWEPIEAGESTEVVVEYDTTLDADEVLEYCAECRTGMLTGNGVTVSIYNIVGLVIAVAALVLVVLFVTGKIRR